MNTPKMQKYTGKCSTFGGPLDTGMKKDEPVSYYPEGAADPHHLFSDEHGRLGHQLNPERPYLAFRFPMGPGAGSMVRQTTALVVNPRTGKKIMLYPADWGPNRNTGRIVDLAPGAARWLGVKTDEVVVVYWPYDGSADPDQANLF